MNLTFESASTLAGLSLCACMGCIIVSDDDGGGTPPEPEEGLTVRVVATDLDNPFEVLWGLDGQLWVTERTGGTVVRVDPHTGETTLALTIEDVLVTPGTQDGLLGMALASDGVFLAYTYDADPNQDAVDRRARISRYTYDPRTETLGDPVELIGGLPASNDHNSGRLVLGPDDKLYYSLGDQGNNQFANFCNPILAQVLPTAEEVAASNWTHYQGKVLRLNLDGSIPGDNPVLDGVRSHVFSYGHRNVQGLTFGPHGQLYQSEHGPKSDDEINVIEAGMNYGWPHVAGYRDDQAYVYANWSASEEPACEALEFSDFEIPASVPRTEETAWNHPDFRPPLMTFHTVPDDYDFMDEDCAENGLYFICWPTIAPSSLGAYAGPDPVIAELENALLVTSLKLGTLYRIPLDDDGLPEGDAEVVLHTTDRYRDVALSPEGDAIYVATDRSGYTMGPDGAPTNELEHVGAILELRRAAD